MASAVRAKGAFCFGSRGRIGGAQSPSRGHEMTALTGHCLCGLVSWSSPGPVTRNLVCHCEDYRRTTSSPLAAFVVIEPESVVWTGDVNHFECSRGTQRGSCRNRGTRLYFRSEKWPGEIHIHAATLDDGIDCLPTAQVVLRSRAPWLEGLHALPGCRDFDAPPKDAGP